MNLAGLYPPIPTPFTADEQVDYAALEKNLARWAAEPLDGVVMPGSNSESAFLSTAERIEIWQRSGAALQGTGKRLIAGTGAESTAETIALTEAAANAGAVATLVLPPFFYKSSMTHEALVAHYRAVADASPIPVLLYNVPAFTSLDLAPNTITTLAEHPQIVGIKDSSANVSKLSLVLAERPGFQVFVGSGAALLPFLSIGAVGAIAALANVAAKPLRQVMDAFAAGDIATARQIQLRLVPLNNAITARYSVAGLKYAMDRVGLVGGPLRRPLLPLGPAAQAEIDGLLAACELIG